MKVAKNKFQIIAVITSVILLFLTLYFQLNKANIYAQIGLFQLKRNQSESAQSYFEKSYDLGNKDTDFRIAYVNLLLNSPLTINSQERIVKVAEDDIQDSASDSAKYFLRNLKKEIHNKYPQNYIQNAPYNQKIMHWGKMPITYSFRNTRGVPKELVTAVNDAFDAWERASSVRIRFDRIHSNNANIVVTFTANRILSPKYGEKYVIATTIPKLSQDKLLKMDVELNIYNHEGKMFTPNQIYNTALHEIFHALGFMGHSADDENLMYMSRDNDELITDERIILTDADKSTLELFYKIKPDITNSHELQYNYIPYLILGDSFELNSVKTEEAKKYIKNAPTVPAGYIDYAQSLLNQKKYALANSYLERALNYAYDEKIKMLIFYNLAVTNYYDGNYELAKVYIKKINEHEEPNEDVQLLLAELYIKEGKTDEGIKIYKTLVSQYPDNIDYSISLANLYIRTKHYLKARQILKNYLKKNPQKRQDSKFQPYGILLIF